MILSIRHIGILVPTLLSLCLTVQAFNIDKRQGQTGQVVNTGPLWEKRPWRADVNCSDSTWLFAAVNSRLFRLNETLGITYPGIANPYMQKEEATITIYDQSLNPSSHTTEWSDDLGSRFRCMRAANWWVALVQDAVLSQQGGDWIQNGQFVHDYYTTADAATGLRIIYGKAAEAKYNPSYGDVYYWLSNSQYAPLIMKLKSDRRFYEAKAVYENNQLTHISLRSPRLGVKDLLEEDKVDVSLDQILPDIDHIGFLSDAVGYDAQL